MFLDELTPIFKELTQQPLAFTGGLFSGVFRLSLSEDPLKSWLEKQTGSSPASTVGTNVSDNGSQGPQSISIE
ncbi:MAG: hypothetical protein BRC40_11990 [Cyanobacteria bacterium QH_8_48_120]|jgi:hypothetical protein|nr:MAG: hypothetical protein BRC34_08550 [Cyanobacteria bacterium QH_1_48_107]PSO54609.1 MAG: hypothetical protein BRC35_13730 [Cyanobacteria bacterium QH_10_48_56]PSO61025.1 MAG: hypothetical protein BRC36_12585 [Cyanobacteria bacterium QH_2_48_84]PSO64123.1 MAG: hypothetical protein BRC39_03205 [Cyanobacteria bacterium QH_7_48_89]PSO65986.1 MAG: hypothetical protein BRC38_07020 [Cyanobacteria bacterium QH_6_48_35]PSO71223.1 MAG: hypothetical protein BRC40_11990 [Cyanobacteria bacterium QH_8_